MNPLRHSVVVIAVAAVAACGDGASPPTAPTPPVSPGPVASPAPTPQPPVNFPPVVGPSRVFTFDRPLGYPVRDFTQQSRFVIYDNGAFVLEYASLNFVLPGQYVRDSSGRLMFLFQFNGRTQNEAWDDAVGTLDGDRLGIEFELTMQHADFENAVYALAP